jgi:hypothetical protein
MTASRSSGCNETGGGHFYKKSLGWRENIQPKSNWLKIRICLLHKLIRIILTKSLNN